jgi:hypothetical protein
MSVRVIIRRYLCPNSGCVSWDTPTHVAALRTRVLHVACAALCSARGRVLGRMRSVPTDVLCSNDSILLEHMRMQYSYRFYSKGSGPDAFGCTMAASLQELLTNRNSWSQVITLELFEGQRNIFGDSYPTEAARKKDFPVVSEAITPVSLFEFEVRELFVEATMKSGCRWWCRRSTPSQASRRVTRSLWSVSMLCSHYEKDYDKQGVDDTRVSRHLVRCSCPAFCKLRAVQVQILFYDISMRLL